ncbi:NACHT, LRR and PYD domains-containing protein 6-like isoform X3 [Mobula hypostoma]
MGGSSSQPQSADRPAEQNVQSSGTAEHQENACSAEFLESQRRWQSHLHQMLHNARIQDIPGMRRSKHSFMLNSVLLMLLVSRVACLPVKPVPDDDKHEFDATDSGQRAEVHSRELNKNFQTNVGQDNRNGAYSQLREKVETGKVNVDEGAKSASNTLGKIIGDSVPSRMTEDRMLTAPKMELDTLQRSEWSGWAKAEALAMPDVQIKEEKQKENRRRRSTSNNFGPGYGWKSVIVHSTSFGKEVSGDKITNKGRTLMLLDREADTSGAKKTAVEVQLCRYIGLPIGFAIVLAACAWLTRCWDRWRNRRHGYEPVGGENNRDEEERSIPGLGGATVSSERYQDPGGLFQGDGAQTQPTDEDPGQAQRQPQPLEHAHAEDGPDKITQVFARYTDLQLCRVTECYHEELKLAIEDVVEHICESLLRAWRMSEINFEEIRKLIGRNQRSDASQHILESVLGGDTENCRMFWNVLLEMQINQQYLMKLLTQDVEIDVKRRHRCNLRNQSRKLNLPKPCLISDIYTELTITVIQGEPPNLIGETNTHICEVQHHELLKQNNRDSDMSTISVVYGAAGTGKTTLIQKLIYDWATGMKYEEFSFVLHLKIQKLNEIKGRITLSRLIVDTYPYLENYLDRLWNEPKRLLFIFDDLDQLYRLFTLSETGRNSDSRYRCVDTESESFVCDILRCLLQGELLSGCSVLITTRVWKLKLLHHVTADSTFQVMGFTFEKAKEYFRRYLRNGQNANEVVEFIEQNELLWNMCSDPLFCVTLASTLESFQAQGEEQETNLIISHTKVLSDYVAHLVAKCDYDGNTHRKCLTTIGELAEKGIKENTLSFESYTLGDPDSSTSMFISAFMHQDPDKKSGSVIYNFRHSVLRDFLAALTNVLNASISRLKQILDEISNDITGRFSTFSIFLFGLSSRKSSDRLELELHTFPTEVTSCISDWLRNSVSRRLKDMDMKHTQRMFLCMLYCLFEFGDNEIMTEVLNPITTIKLNHLRLKSPDCIVLSRTLIAPEVIQELDLSSCFAQPEEIWKLEQVLSRCVILRLNQNNLQDSGVKRLFDVLNQSNIRTLTLKSNHLTDNCLESVFVALTTNPSLMQLNLSNSSQDGEQVNQFTDEKLQYYSKRSTQQREIKWLRIKDIGQDIVQSVTESKRLTLITE